MEEKERAKKIFKLLKQHYPQAKMILNYSNNWELLVAVILSAQCTDVMVNKVTARLFPKYQKPYQVLSSKYQVWKGKSTLPENELVELVNFAEVNQEELEQDIRSTGFYKNKAKNIQQAARLVLEKFNGVLPRSIAEMITIPGVARKTANVVLGNAYRIYEGIAVDTHVSRLSQRLGLSKKTTPEKIEQDLMKLFPPAKGEASNKNWFLLTYLLIEHGRNICIAKKPKCNECILNTLCPSAFAFPHFKNKKKS